MAKKKTRLQIHVNYPATQYPDKDQELKKVVGRIANDSGMFMGERDLWWFFSNPMKALKAFKSLKEYNPTMTYSWD